MANASVSRILVNRNKNRINGAKPAIPEKPLALKNILQKKEPIRTEKECVYRAKDKHLKLPINTLKRVGRNLVVHILKDVCSFNFRRGDFPTMTSLLI